MLLRLPGEDKSKDDFSITYETCEEKGYQTVTNEMEHLVADLQELYVEQSAIDGRGGDYDFLSARKQQLSEGFHGDREGDVMRADSSACYMDDRKTFGQLSISETDKYDSRQFRAFRSNNISGPGNESRPEYSKLSEVNPEGINGNVNRQARHLIPVVDPDVHEVTTAWVQIGEVKADILDFNDAFDMSGKLRHLNDTTRAAPQVKVIITDSGYNFLKTVYTDSHGFFRVEGLQEKMDYRILVEDRTAIKSERSKYLLKNLTIESDIKSRGNGNTPERAPLVVYFDFDSFLLSDKARKDITSWLAEGGDINEVIVIEGHADKRGSGDYNMKLSLKRAQAVLRALEELGVSGATCKVNAFGETKLLTNDDNMHHLNRRVEVEVQK